MGRKRRFTRAEIEEILRLGESGDVVIERLCRERGIAKGTYYRWKEWIAGLRAKEQQAAKETERAKPSEQPAVSGPQPFEFFARHIHAIRPPEELLEENRRLKQMLADLILENAGLRETMERRASDRSRET